MFPYRSLFVFIDSNWSLCVFIGPCAFLWVLMGLISSNASLYIPMGNYKSLRVPTRPYGSLWVFILRFASLRILMGSYGSLSFLILRYGL